MGSVGGHATVNATTIAVPATDTLARLADQIEKCAAVMGLTETTRLQLERDASELKRQVAGFTPDPTVLRRVVSSIRGIAENAAGDLLAAGILHELGRPEVVAFLARLLS